MSDYKLLPCPFCGEMPAREVICMGEAPEKHYVVCQNENCPCGPQTYAHRNQGVVTRAWNTRAQLSRQKGE